MTTIDLKAARLTDAVTLGGDVLTIPAEGGGIRLDEIAGRPERWLNLTMTVLNDHAQAFELRVDGAGESPRVVIRFGLMPSFRAAVAIDLNWLDGHILFPGHRVGTQKVVCHGSRIDRAEITGAALVAMPCFEPVTVRVESVELSDEPCALTQPAQGKLIDRFGQYIPKEWPGKVRDEAELTDFLTKEAARPDAYPHANWSAWGGSMDEKLGEGTGFFRAVKRDGRWYIQDPDGCAFFSIGPDCVIARADARIDGLEALLEDLPPDDQAHHVLYESARRAFGETRRGPAVMFSYERANLMRAFGDDWKANWHRLVVGQLKRIGMNTLGNWSDPDLFGMMPYVTSLPAFPTTKQTIFRDFPDVMSDEYEQNARTCAEALRARRDDPWMIGYFLRNEPEWAFVDGLIIADEVLRNPADTACKRALIAFLSEKYGTADALSRAWARPFDEFDALMEPIDHASGLSDQAREDLRAFSERLIQRYMRVPAQACRAVDPNHMILGMRWAWISDPVLVSGWDCFDVFSINCYAVDPTAAIENVRSLGVDLPVMIGEFHFGALDRGPFCPGLILLRDQQHRAQTYKDYVRTSLEHPQIVGVHWHQFSDQATSGRFDGENMQVGWTDVCDTPYWETVEAVREIGAHMYEIRNRAQSRLAD